ncbi:Methyltransferase domain-containing protein [Austwickia chelonae]|nr:Methyltransferase domain-containing protein [Austwickia chelonae]
MTSVRLGFFDLLGPEDAQTPLTEIAAHCRISVEAADVLAEALTGMGLLTRTATGCSATPLAAAHLTIDAPYSLRHWVVSEHEKYVNFAGLAEALRAEPPARDDPVRAARRRHGPPAAQMQGLAEVARARGTQTARIIRRLCPAESGRILDAGGGHGMDSITVLRDMPGWTAVVADRPGPLTAAGDNIERYAMGNRVELREADLESDALRRPDEEGFDIAFLFMVLGGKPPAEAAAVLRQVQAALVPGGWLLIRGNWTDQLRGATSALKHMLRPGGRRTLTQERLLELLEDTGFLEVHTVTDADVDPNAVVAARTPEQA